MRSTFKILFYIKGNAIKSNGKAPVMARITLDGKISQFSLKCEVNPSEWNSKAGKAIGKSVQSQKLNVLLDNFKAKLIQHFCDISERDTFVTAEKIRNAFLGQELHSETLLGIFGNHIELLKKKYEKQLISKSQMTKYERTYRRLGYFIEEKFHVSDLSIKEINYSFIFEFEIFLKTKYGCGHNSTIKFIQQLRTIILLAINNGWLSRDPFANYKFCVEKTERPFLTQTELEVLMHKNFSIKRLEQVRDVFLFSCFTGLAYIDVKNLTKENVKHSFDNNLWLIGKRVKTNISYRVPLLDIPKMILEKYKNNANDEYILPVLSNQKMNAYLKEIADVCGVNKNLSFHTARHTFATTVTLSKGVSIESVSKMLGHTNIKTTQIYARILDTKISEDMAILADKLKGIESKLIINQ